MLNITFVDDRDEKFVPRWKLNEIAPISIDIINTVGFASQTGETVDYVMESLNNYELASVLIVKRKSRRCRDCNRFLASLLLQLSRGP